MGATSRPDLIDPAVIRPGRLDKMIMCDFPNEEERFDILNLYYKKAVGHLTRGIEDCLRLVSVKTQYYTGADLQSLIYNSFLISVKRNISLNIDESPIIIAEDIETAFAEFKRSLSDKDIQFQEELKKKFILRISQDEDYSINISTKTTLY